MIKTDLRVKKPYKKRQSTSMTEKTINLVEPNDSLDNINKTSGNKLRSEDTVMEDLNEENAECIRQKETDANQLDQLRTKTELKIFKQVALLHEQFANNCEAETVQGHRARHPKELILESVLHYLSALQKVLSAGRIPIDQAWKTWLLVVFDHDHNMWYEQYLEEQDLNWEQVKQVVQNKFNSFDRQLEMGSLVFTMVMEHNESVMYYSTCFQKACRKGNVQDSNHLAM
ncbi:hypothetical protein F4703DRAFT_1796018 [Phycomyces blakesleeanus]